MDEKFGLIFPLTREKIGDIESAIEEGKGLYNPACNIWLEVHGVAASPEKVSLLKPMQMYEEYLKSTVGEPVAKFIIERSNPKKIKVYNKIVALFNAELFEIKFRKNSLLAVDFAEQILELREDQSEDVDEPFGKPFPLSKEKENEIKADIELWGGLHCVVQEKWLNYKYHAEDMSSMIGLRPMLTYEETLKRMFPLPHAEFMIANSDPVKVEKYNELVRTFNSEIPKIKAKRNFKRIEQIAQEVLALL